MIANAAASIDALMSSRSGIHRQEYLPRFASSIRPHNTDVIVFRKHSLGKLDSIGTTSLPINLTSPFRDSSAESASTSFLQTTIYHTPIRTDMSAKVWLITGCSSGFGSQLALEALSRGFNVIATARNPAKTSHLKDAGASTLALDVTQPLPELHAIAKEAFSIHNRIDFLVNNAGYNQVGGLEELTPEETQAQFGELGTS